jgi:DNA polymerase-3 subunit alpha
VCGLKLLPPDINLSDYRFTPVGEPGKRATQIRYGLGAVKGSGQNAIEAIIAARQDGPFTDLFDFVKRVDKRQINRRTIESLIRAGAFDCFNVDRGVLLASVNFAMECAEQAEASANQVSLFGGDDGEEAPPDYVKAAPWTEKQKLTEEKSALGFYLSGHLFNAYAEEARRFARTKLANLEPAREPKLIAGIISAMRVQMTQRGKMVIVTLDDASATVDVTVYNELYEPNRHLFKEDEFLAVQGKVSEDRFSGGLRISAEKVMDIALARVQFARGLQLAMNGQADAAKLQQILQSHRSAEGCPVIIAYQKAGASAEIRLANEWRVRPDEVLRQKLVEWLSSENVQINY